MGLFLHFLEEIIRSKSDYDNVNSQRNVIYKTERTKSKHLPKELLLQNKEVTKKVKLGVLLYVYIMYHDDGKISMGEKREIVKVMKEKEGYLSKQDIKEMKSFIKNVPSIGFIIDFAKDHHLPYELVTEMLMHFRLTTEHDERYDKALSRIEREFIIEKEFMA